MVKIMDRGSVIEHALGSLGLFLLGLTGWAAEPLQGRAPIAAVLARLVLRCVMAVGWVIDRLPLPDSTFDVLRPKDEKHHVSIASRRLRW